MEDITRFIEVDRKEYLTLLAPIAEKAGVDLHNVTSIRADHSGVEFDYVEREYPMGANRRTARVHVFDGVTY
jgi:hypothetical protein